MKEKQKAGVDQIPGGNMSYPDYRPVERAGQTLARDLNETDVINLALQWAMTQGADLEKEISILNGTTPANPTQIDRARRTVMKKYEKSLGL